MVRRAVANRLPSGRTATADASRPKIVTLESGDRAVSFPVARLIGSPIALFICSAIAIVPLAGWMGRATEALAGRMGGALDAGAEIERQLSVAVGTPKAQLVPGATVILLGHVSVGGVVSTTATNWVQIALLLQQSVTCHAPAQRFEQVLPETRLLLSN